MSFSFRYMLFWGMLVLWGAVCAEAQPFISETSLTQESMRQNPGAALKQIRRSLHNALEGGNTYEAAICYAKIGELYYFQAAYAQALDNFYQAAALLDGDNHAAERAMIWIKIGETNFSTRQYPTSLEAFELALSLYKTAERKEGEANALAHIGQVYEKTQHLQEAQRYQYLALARLGDAPAGALRAKIYENIGSVYEDKLQLDSALFFFNKALQISKQLQDRNADIQIINNIGDVYRKTGDYEKAMGYTKKAIALSEEMNEQYQLASAYRDMSKIFAALGRYDSAYHYSEAGREIQVGIFSEDHAKRLTVLQSMYDLEQKESAILQFERERKIHYSMLLFGAAIVLLLLFLAVSVISRQRLKIANEKKLNEQNKKLYQTQKVAMETELHNKKLKAESLHKELELKAKELTSHTLHLIQKNQLLDELQQKLEAVVKSEKRDQRKELKQIIQLIQHNHNQDKNWDDFRVVFERVHEHFFDALKAQSDALTASDLRLAALLKMNLSSSDIATMLGISPDSLRISRYRLRKKLQLPEGESLATFIQKL